MHLPFCRSKCHYCDFNSYAGLDSLFPGYVDALARELAWAAPLVEGRKVATVYVGGGTPTLLGPGPLGRLLKMVRDHLRLAPGAEITVEANPGTVAAGDFPALLEAGYNRISFGVQSFRPGLLRRLGRIHSPEEAREAVAGARAEGFPNVSLDLIYGLPGQDLSVWRRDLEEAVGLQPQHISAYGLQVEAGTSFYRWWQRGELVLPDEETEEAMFDLTREYLGQAGYEAYEISSFARPGFRCRHNELYWRNGEYVGVGAGAASYLKGSRETNLGDPSAYVEAVQAGLSPRAEFDRLDGKGTMAETVILALRTADGLSAKGFLNRFGVRVQDEYGGTLEGLQGQGLVEWQGDSLRLTPRGLKLGNVVFRAFL
ncbi:MAG: radical SAM family heme chaperone HemW [Firmicutes bacterium]|nr:radical SAM family heme chaperone HemW [Bacillota bacterium]